MKNYRKQALIGRMQRMVAEQGGQMPPAPPVPEFTGNRKQRRAQATRHNRMVKQLQKVLGARVQELEAREGSHA